MTAFLQALFLSAGYNAALVAIGSALLGFAAGAVGTFLFLRKRALLCDAIAHATLPGVGLAFLLMVLMGGEGRHLMGLLLGAAATAGLGLYLIEWMTRRTRLSEDASIGAILSVFFGAGIVLLTIIQSLTIGRQAGLEDFLLGSTAGMLFQEAVLIALGGALAVGVLYAMRRPMTLVAFDPDYALAAGYRVRSIDFAIMGLAMAVVVIGLKIVGLVLIVALLIIPPVAARFWTERSERVLWLSAGFGAISGYLGVAISASAPALPAGPIIVLVAAALFTLSLLFAPSRGVLAALLRHRSFQRRVHLRQGLLALARNEPIRDRLTLRVLRAQTLIRPDGVATGAGRAQAAKAVLDEVRWGIARRLYQDTPLSARYDGVTPIEEVFTRDQIAEFDRQLETPRIVARDGRAASEGPDGR